jgi:hypothetical protein
MEEQTVKTWTTAKLAEEAKRRGKLITAERIRQLCKIGEIKAEKPGRDWLITDAEARAWLERWLGED